MAQNEEIKCSLLAPGDGLGPAQRRGDLVTLSLQQHAARREQLLVIGNREYVPAHYMKSSNQGGAGIIASSLLQGEITFWR